MAEIVKTITNTSRGEGSSSRTNYLGNTEQTRTETPGTKTRTRRPTKTTVKKGGYENVSKQDPSESSQTQKEDIGITVTFKLKINNFLGTGSRC